MGAALVMSVLHITVPIPDRNWFAVLAHPPPAAAAGSVSALIRFYTILALVVHDRAQVLALTRRLLEMSDEVRERDETQHRHLQHPLHLLHGRALAAAALLAVQRDHHACERGPAVADDLHRLADGGARRDDVVHDEHPALQRRADGIAALAVRLRLLAVEAVGHVDVVMLGQ